MRKLKFFSLSILLFLISLSVHAQQGQSKVTLELQNVSLGKAMKAIEKASGYTFFYDAGQVDLTVKVSLNVVDMALSDAIDIMLKPLGLSFEISGTQVAVMHGRADDVSGGGRTISGLVLDPTQEPLIGVAVIVGDYIESGVATDINGRFSISAPEGQTVTLAFSSLGYVTRKVSVPSSQSEVKVYMNEDATMLEEAVAVGYGTQKKVNLTGAVSTLESETLHSRTSPTLTHMLQGTIPGLNITTSSGMPGSSASINIRGINSINGGSPLILIDGAEGDLKLVNPADVESISVVKDASSAAIYGARASYGVILVTTKSGQVSDGKAKVSYSGKFGWGEPTTSTDFETRGYYSVYLNDLFYKSYAGVNYTRYTEEDMMQLWIRKDDKVEDPSRPWVMIDQRNGQDTYVYYANTDWYHELFRDSHPNMSHNLSFSGGTRRFKYFFSGSYYSETGIFKQHPDKFRKVNLRSRMSFDVNDWINVSNNTSYYNSFYDYPGISGANNAFLYSTVHALASFPAKNPDGSSIYRTAFSNYEIMDGFKTILDKDMNKNQENRDNISTTTELTLKPVKGLEIKANLTYAFNNKRSMNRQVNTVWSQVPGVMEDLKTGIFEDKLKENSETHQYMQANVFATYQNSWKGHNFKATAGYNWETKYLKDVTAKGYNILSENLNDLNLVGQNSEGEKRMEVSGGQNEYALAGVFARINYDYREKYLVEVSGRYDGTSRFGSGHRWGFFPSASVGWRISEEKFFNPVKEWFNNLKIRYSFGQLGNQQVGYYDYIRKISISDQNYLFGGGKPTIATISAPVASDLTWEIAQHQNLGVDMAFFSNRLGFTGEFYIRDTKNMLTSGIALPSVYGTSSPKMNAADLRTKGYELSLAWKDMFNLAGHPFAYNVSVVFSDYVTDITKFNNPEKSFSKTYYEGMRWGEIWGYRIGGLFTSDEEAAAYAVDQTAVNNIINSSAGNEKGLKAGDMKFLDLDGDGKISKGQNTVDNPGDREIIGNKEPRYNYGINLGFDWCNIDFSIFFQGVGHIDWYPPANARLFWGPYGIPYSTFIPKDFHKQIWSEDNPDSYFPRPRGYVAHKGDDRELTAVNDRYLQNIGYCRLKNVTVGYTLPKKWTRKINIDAVRVYFTGENLVTWSGIKSDYIDPEMARTGGQLTLYPWQKTYMFGIDINF